MSREQILGLITPIMALVFATVFLVLWRRGRMDRHVLGFAAAYAFFAIGFLCTHALDPARWFVFHLTQVFYALGTVAMIWGAARRVGQSLPLVGVATVYLLTAATLAVAISVSNDIGPRLYIVNSGYGVMFVMGLMAMVQAPRRTAVDTLIVVVFAISAAQLFIRPVLTLLIAGSGEASAYRDTVYYSVLSVAVTIQSVITAVALIGACVHDMLAAERERAERDGLTGLRARRAFEQDALTIIERAKAEGVAVSLVVADIDHFKSVNDVYGHQTGDRAIAGFGNVLAAMIRNVDVAGRVGGEEFCILAWNCDAAQAAAMAERIRRRFADTQVAGMPADVRLTASFGVAEREDGEGYGKLFARADAELYRAKNGGRNQVSGAPEPSTVEHLVTGRERPCAAA